jgi:hypothetical protein
MICDSGTKNSASEEDYLSLVDKVFDNPKAISQGEYTAIYEFLLSPDIRDDPDAIIHVLEEFSGWAHYMLEQMRKLDILD